LVQVPFFYIAHLRKVLDATGSVEAVSYSPGECILLCRCSSSSLLCAILTPFADGAFLAVGDGNRNLFVFDVAAGHSLVRQPPAAVFALSFHLFLFIQLGSQSHHSFPTFSI
jgi:CDGSH-type Zn-finger protein